ncbi:hypothetical protein B0H34DRAFT_188768 [Crassisporium funariophilum]|nr:hypothetical protein B0H34DRAFT_188768 [Crassisporium funariophilum]
MPNDLPALHLIGTQAFLPALLSYIHGVASPASLPLDHVIFQSILLCLIAGDKHLILRTPEEDVGLAVKLAVWTLSSIFNLPTHKIKIRSRSSTRSNVITSSADPAVFLRSLFFPSGYSSSNSNQTSQDEGSGENAELKHFGHHRQQGRPRSSRQKSKLPDYSRSRSFPNNLVGAAQNQGNPGLPDALLLQGSTTTVHSAANASGSSISKPRPIYPHETPGLQHSHTDPLPLPAKRKRVTSQPKIQLQLPVALVISGLENATDSTQRSLAKVLAERKVVLEGKKDGIHRMAEETKQFGDGTSSNDDEDGVWKLPAGFITVYVCPINSRERPAIHKTLLDKFAMSSNIFIPQEIRHDFRLLPFTPAPRPFHPHFFSHSNPGSPSPSHPMTLPPTHTPPTFTKALPITRRPSNHFISPPLPEDVLPRSFIEALRDARHKSHISHTLSLYLSDIFSATRHNSRLDAMLLTAKAMKDAEDLIRASRVIGTDLTGMELNPTSYDYQRLADHASKTVDTHSDSPENVATTTPHVHRVLDVSEVDIARIVPRVISHRVSMRDGAEDEVLSSALFGATFRPKIPNNTANDGGHITEDRMQTVKGVLVQILSEV